MKRIANVFAVAFLVVALMVTAGVLLGGCSNQEEEQAKADLGASLTQFETAVAELQKMGATSTLADLMAANASLIPLFSAVVQAATKVPGADVATFENAWTALQATVAAIPPDASIVTAGLQILPKLQPVIDAEKALKALVEPE